jgi:hypothetical protein
MHALKRDVRACAWENSIHSMQEQLIRQRMLMQNAVVTQCMLHLMVVPLGSGKKNATCPYIMYPSNYGFCWCLENCKRHFGPAGAIIQKTLQSAESLEVQEQTWIPPSVHDSNALVTGEGAQALRVGYTELSAKKTVMKPEYPSTYISTYYISTYVMIVRPSAS